MFHWRRRARQHDRGDVTASHVVRSTPKGSSCVPSPLLLGDYLYTVNDMIGVVSCHHAKTGELVGQFRLGEAKREGFSASPVAVEGKIFFTNDDGETFVLSPAPDCRLLHVNRLNEQTLASPALVDGRWYVRTAGRLLAIGSVTAGRQARSGSGHRRLCCSRAAIPAQTVRGAGVA